MLRLLVFILFYMISPPVFSFNASFQRTGTLLSETATREKKRILDTHSTLFVEGKSSLTSKPFFPMKLWTLYLVQLEERGQLTRMLSSAFISSLGDALGQLLTFFNSTERIFCFDWRRTAVFTFMGLFFSGVMVHPWLCFIDNVGMNFFPEKEQRASKAMVMLILDQTFGSIILNFCFLFLFNIVTTISLGRSFATTDAIVVKAFHEAHATIVPVLLANWKIWPVVNFLNFFFVPLELRLLVANLAGVVWNVILSLMIND